MQAGTHGVKSAKVGQVEQLRDLSTLAPLFGS
jgi:hypothetical protein